MHNLVDNLHADRTSSLVLALFLLLIGAKLSAALFTRLKLPAVLGELCCGVVLGNLSLLKVGGVNFTYLDYLASDPALEVLAQLGVLLLLFEVGLSSTVKEMLKVGPSSLLVAVIGVLVPLLLGCGVSFYFLRSESFYVHLFIGATLSATSVGITARVLKDLHYAHTSAARIILGAAVIDDVLGLILLAMVTGLIHAADLGSSLSYGAIVWLFAKAVLFLGVALTLGVYLAPRLFAVASKLRAEGLLLTLGLACCFFWSWVATLVGLAAIVGAFAAGLILEEVHYHNFREVEVHSLSELLKPLTDFLVPIFFVLMGIRTDLRVFARPEILGLAGVLTVAAIIGKQFCALGVLAKKTDKFIVGLGMIPRGEVGLIFANMGLQLTLGGQKIIDDALFTAIVMMVMFTTFVTPPLLKWRINRLSSL